MRRGPAPAARGRGLTVGLTGGVASGKSTVAAFLARRGAHVIEADAIGHELLRPGRATAREVVRAFGSGILDEAGRIDRGRLGAVVFSDPDALAHLNAIVHPPLLRELARRARRAAREHAVVLVVAALLVDWDWRAPLDVLVVVDAPRELQLARLAGKGIPRRAALRRIRAQVDRRTRRAAADHVILNDGDLRTLRRRTAALWKELRATARLRGPVPAPSIGKTPSRSGPATGGGG